MATGGATAEDLRMDSAIRDYLHYFSDYLEGDEIKRTENEIIVIFPVDWTEIPTPKLIMSHISELCRRYSGHYKLQIAASFLLINRVREDEGDPYRFFYGSNNTNILPRPLIIGPQVDFNLIMKALQRAYASDYQSPDVELLAERSKERWTSLIIAFEYKLFKI